MQARKVTSTGDHRVMSLPCAAESPGFDASAPERDGSVTRNDASFDAGKCEGVPCEIDCCPPSARWNQHAYAVTHVGPTGSIPRTSAWRPNHRVPDLNTFRANAQGDLEVVGAADLTVALARPAELCDAATGKITFEARVRNRGTNPATDGAPVVFYMGDPDEGAEVACRTRLPRFVGVADCATVNCDYEHSGELTLRDVTVVVDPEGTTFECRRGNNRGVLADIYCGLL